MKQKKQETSLWLKIFLWIAAVLYVFKELIINLKGEYTAYEFGYATGSIFGSFIGFGINWLCANKCSLWAREIKKSMNIAYAVGFILGLVGLVGYWIYYNYTSRNAKNI